MKKSAISIVLLILSIVGTLNAQDLTSYNLYNLPQSNALNPAQWPECKVFVGIPGVSNIQLSLKTSGFYMEDILSHQGALSGLITDDLIIGNDFSTSILNFGFKAGKSFISFDLGIKNSMGLTIPKDMGIFMTELNKNYIGQTMDLSGLELRNTLYSEASLSYARQIGDRLRIGVRAKYLNGITDLSTSKWNATIYTAPDTYEMDLHTDIEMNVSGPFEVTYSSNNPDQVDGIDMMDLNESELIDRYLLQNQNVGFGFDFGAVYQLSDKLELSASVLNMYSKINWQNDVITFVEQGDFHFSGLDFNPYIEGNDSQDQMDLLLDSIADEFSVSSHNTSYTNALNPSYFLNANYQLLSWLNAGGTIYGKVINNQHFLTYSASANAHIGRFLTGSVSYSILNSGDVNLGVGMGVKLAFLQFYIVSDNITGIYYDPVEKILWPGSTQNMNLRFGLNLQFGCMKNEE